MKKKVLLVFIALFLLFIKIDVNAACTNEDLEALKLEAYNIKASTSLILYDEEEVKMGGYRYGYDLLISNVTDNFYVEMFGKGDENNEIIVQNAFSSGGYSYELNIYTNNKTKCPNRLIRNLHLDVPVYNTYSTRDECANYKKYPICKENTNTENISEEQFLSEIKKAEAKEKEIRESNKTTIYEKISSFWDENKNVIIFSIIAIVIVAIIIAVFIIIKNKNKVKIDLGGEL